MSRWTRKRKKASLSQGAVIRKMRRESNLKILKNSTTICRLQLEIDALRKSASRLDGILSIVRPVQGYLSEPRFKVFRIATEFAVSTMDFVNLAQDRLVGVELEKFLYELSRLLRKQAVDMFREQYGINLNN